MRTPVLFGEPDRNASMWGRVGAFVVPLLAGAAFSMSFSALEPVAGGVARHPRTLLVDLRPDELAGCVR